MDFTEQQLHYINARSIEGRVLNDDEVLSLPISRVHQKEWKMRKHAWNKLSNFLIKTQRKGSAILDLGCGNGWMSNGISELGFEVSGMDVNQVEVSQAKRLFPNVSFHAENVFEWNERKFDVIIIAGAFQYFDDVEKLFEKLKALLNENGRLIILETFFYSDQEAVKAKQASDRYYKSIGVSEMGSYYFHQKWSSLSSQKYRVIYRFNVIFKLLNRFGGNYSPFPIIEVSL